MLVIKGEIDEIILAKTYKTWMKMLSIWICYYASIIELEMWFSSSTWFDKDIRNERAPRIPEQLSAVWF